jgi:hypothetical protein
MLLQDEGEDLRESLALPHSAGESFNFNLDSEMKMGMQRRGGAAFSPSLPIGGEGGEEVLLVRRAAQVEWPGSLA